MGIFGALSTSVTGLRAQSFALENISGNIANSQTTAFKRIDTSFQDLIPDASANRQLAGSVLSLSRATNTTQGDIQGSSIPTYMAINGEGFFVIQQPSSFVDGNPVFDGVNLYTRRGDFEVNKDGYLVNGAGYFLMGIPVDATTGNLVGSVPQLLQFQNDFLPAQPTTQITYRANLASFPLTPKSDPSVLGSELLNPVDFTANPLVGAPAAAKITGSGAALADVIGGVTGSATFANPAVTQLGAGNGGLLRVRVGVTNFDVTLNDTDTLNGIVAAINGTAGLGAGGAVVASIDTTGGTNKLRLAATSADVDFSVDAASADVTTTALGIGEATYASSNLIDKGVAQNEVLTIDIGGTPFAVTFGANAGEVSTIGELATRLAALNPALGTATTDSNGNITITAAGTNTINVSSQSTAAKFGMTVVSAIPANQTVVASDVTAFLQESISGGAITAFDVSGSPVNIQLRWAKVDSANLGAGHSDAWNLFYQVSSTATGTQPAWQNVGTNFTFGANGQMNPVVGSLTLPGVTIDGVALGTLSVSIGSGGLTQFSDPNGTVQVNLLQQNGFAAGSLQSIAVNDKGRVVGSYSNGRSIDLAQITLADFNGANFLKRLDGGAFEVTDESGAAIIGASGNIVNSSLESSNTDIGDEFTKLIVTQQAYSANTRVITTTNQMVQDLLNMLR